MSFKVSITHVCDAKQGTRRGGEAGGGMHMSTVVRFFIEDSNQQNLQSRANDRTMGRFEFRGAGPPTKQNLGF
jgi:hypothetical protein